MTRARHHSTHHGVTLIELLVGIAILAILLSIAVPSYRQMVVNRRVTGATEAVLADLRLAQSEALKRNQNVSVNFNATTFWPYNLQVVSSSEIIKTIDRSEFQGVTPTAGANTLTFESKRGNLAQTAGSTSQATLVTLAAAAGTGVTASLRIIADQASQLQLCTPSSATMKGYKPC